MLEQGIEHRIGKLGFPLDPVPLTEQQKYFAREHLPPAYAAFLIQCGFGHYFNRGWQFCDSQYMKSLAAIIFKGDPDFSHRDCHIVGFSAFGHLKLWSERHWIVDIDLLKYELTCSRLAPNIHNIPIPAPKSTTREVTPNSISRNLLPYDRDDCEFWDRDGREMFDRCVEAYGNLEGGECFGFVPSLGATGYNSKYRYVKYVKKLKALEHFCIIAQMKDFHLVRHNMGNVEQIRIIG